MLGDYLKTHREKAGLTVREISSRTKIRSEYLKALESEDFTKIPGEVFIKGYIREYLRTLSIEPSEALGMYDELKRSSQSTRPPVQERARRRRLPSHIVPLLILSVAVPLVILLYRGGDHERPAGRAEKGKIPVVTMIPNPVTPAEADYRNKHVLEIDVMEKTWLYLKIDDNLSYSMLLEPGQRKVWTADRGFFVKVGNAGGIRLTLDGKDLGVPGKRGRVVRLTLPDQGSE